MHGLHASPAPLTGGRVFQAANGDLEHFVLTDFVRRRRR